ncbi:MAG: DUF1786 family protein [Chloroflexota bacterium]
MQILAVDIGTGTQDIFLYDSRLDIENGYKLVVPSPTVEVYHRIREATRRGETVLLTGVTMGGGPSQWAAEEHARSGLPIYATPDAARSFNDDLEAVQDLGITVVSDDEAASFPSSVTFLELRDFNFVAIKRAFRQFGVPMEALAAVAVAVFDHGAAPKGYSDRQFRFDYLDVRIREENRLSAFAYRAEEVPPIMTRLQAVVDSAEDVDAPLVVMDTAPAAVLGATFDHRLGTLPRKMIVNVGNFHTLAFRLGVTGIEGVMEHHTGLMDLPKLEGLLEELAAGTLTHKAVFADHGHGALIYSPEPLPLHEGDFGVVVTGPRRNLMWGSRLRPHFAVPFGDMMLTGCFGLLTATADLLPSIAEPVRQSLNSTSSSGVPPWEVE